MKVMRVDTDFELLENDDFHHVINHLASRIGISLNLIHCLDLYELDEFKSRFDLVDKRFVLFYIFNSLNDSKKTIIAKSLRPGETFDSISSHWANANLFESEISKNFGINFYHKEERVKYKFLEFESAPYMKDYAPNKVINDINEPSIDEHDCISMEEFHIYSKGVYLKTHESRDGIDRIDVLTGKPKQIDKIIEGKPLNKVIHYMSLYNTLDRYHYENLWQETLECIAGEKIDLYQKSLRMLFQELHYGIRCLEILRDTLFVLKEKYYTDKVMALLKRAYEIISTAKMSPSFKYQMNYKGKNTLTPQWKSLATSELKDITERIRDLDKSLSHLSRLKNIKFGEKNIDVIKEGFSGAPLRNYGISYDMRINDSYYLYQDLGRDRPLGINDELYDRILVKIEDAFQSFSDVIRIIESLPSKESRSFLCEVRNNSEQDKIFYSYTESVVGRISFMSTVKKEQGSLYDFYVFTPTRSLVNMFQTTKRKLDYKLAVIDWISLGASTEELRS